ncbi:right-handed parallel beta-helix repeat-containing protein, partial [Candidatus Micrarchaeota archaeon]|nr:right-handed parallel beta-helix repeat-containing protein [Candidatus Micrarchaeota archaeon]
MKSRGKLFALIVIMLFILGTSFASSIALTSPKNNAVISDDVVTLSFIAESNNFDFLSCTIKLHDGIDEIVFDPMEVQNGSENTVFFGPLEKDREYLWRVECNDSAELFHSEVFIFKTFSSKASSPSYSGFETMDGTPDCTCDSCESCEAALLNISCTHIHLTTDISSSGNCIYAYSWGDSTARTLDCTGNKISGSGTGYGIYLVTGNKRIMDCTIEGFNIGVMLGRPGSTLSNLTIRNNVYSGAYVSGWASNSKLDNLDVYNSSRTMDYIVRSAIRVSDGADNTVISNSTIRNNPGIGLQIYSSDSAILENITSYGNGFSGVDLFYSYNSRMRNIIAYSNSNEGIYMYSTRYLDANNLTLSSNGFGIEMQASGYNNFSNLNITSGGIYIAGPWYAGASFTTAYMNRFTNVLISNSNPAFSFYPFADYTIITNFTCANSIKCISTRTGDNFFINDAHFYGSTAETIDLYVPLTYIDQNFAFSNVIFDHSAGAMTDYTNLTLSGIVGSSELQSRTGNFEAYSAAVPTPEIGLVPFKNQFTYFYTYMATYSNLGVNSRWTWTDSDLTGFNETRLKLFHYGSSWTEVNGTPDLVNNMISLTKINSGGTGYYGIMEDDRIFNCTTIDSPGRFWIVQNLIGAPEDASPLPGLACIKINVSNVDLDCTGYSITNNGTPGTTYGVLLNSGLTNITLKNCSGISGYTYGFHAQDSNHTFFNSRLFNNNYDVVLGSSSGFPSSTNLTSITFDRPAGDLNSYTSIDLVDSIASLESYYLNWSAIPGPLNQTMLSFRNKYVSIGTLSGTPSIDSISWRWSNSELGTYYNESMFNLQLFSSSWQMMNNTPDITANSLSLSNLNTFGIFGLFENDSIAPELTIQSPTASSYNTTSINLNYTVYDLHLDKCWYSLNGAANITLYNCQNISITGIEGPNTIIVYANDSAQNQNSSLVSFTIDTSGPNIIIQSPTNTTYAFTLIDLNYTAEGAVSCWYSLDEQPNITLASCANTTLPALWQGGHNVNLYANDSLNNLENKSVFFSVNTNLAIVLNSPNPGETLNAPLVTLNWTPYNYTLTPRCNVSRNGTLIFSDNCTTDQPCTTTNFTSDGLFFWNVTCYSAVEGTFSETRNFSVDSRPKVFFVQPTPENNSAIDETEALIKTRIIEAQLTGLTYEWLSSNYSIYDYSLTFLMSLDNNSALGENETHAADVSLFSNNGTINGAVWSSGLFNSSLYFNGIDNNMSLFDSPIKGENWSMLLWIKPSSFSAYSTIYSWYPGGWFRIYLGDNGQPILSTNTDGERNYTLENVSLGIWNNIQIISFAGNISVYVNNVSAGSYLFTMPSGSASAFFGSDGSNYFNGSLDQISAFNRSISTAQKEEFYSTILYKENPANWYLESNKTSLAIGNYSYSVWANNTENEVGSNYTVFKTIAIDLNGPANNSAFISVPVTFNWTPRNFASNPSCQIMRNGSIIFSGVCANNAPCTYTEDTPPKFHLWNVTCIYGNESAVSETRNFSMDKYGCVGEHYTYACNETVNESCTMNTNLEINDSHCFTIGNNSVKIDCAGFTITGNKATNKYGVNINTRSNITVENCNFVNYQYGIVISSSDPFKFLNNTFFNNTNGIYVSASSTGVISNNTVLSSTADNMYITGSSIIILSNNTVTNSTSNGIFMQWVYNLSIFDNQITNCSGAAMVIRQDSSSCRVINNTVFNSGGGFDFQPFNDALLANNTFANLTGNALSIGTFGRPMSRSIVENNTIINVSGSATFSYPINSSIRNNYLAGSGALSIGSASGTSVSSNIINTSTSGTCLYLGYSSYNNLTDNFLYKCGNRALYVDAGGWNTLINNTVLNCSGTGFFLWNTPYTVFINNTAENNSQIGVSLWSGGDHHDQMIGNRIIRNNRGMDYGGVNGIITGNLFQYNTNGGITLWNDNEFYGNIVRDNLNFGIAGYASNISIHDNIINNNSQYGVELISGGSNSTVARNNISNHTYGIYFLTWPHRAEENRIFDSQFGIYLSGMNASIYGNIIYNINVTAVILGHHNITVANNIVYNASRGLDIGGIDSVLLNNTVFNSSNAIIIQGGYNSVVKDNIA